MSLLFVKVPGELSWKGVEGTQWGLCLPREAFSTVYGMVICRRFLDAYPIIVVSERIKGLLCINHSIVPNVRRNYFNKIGRNTVISSLIELSQECVLGMASRSQAASRKLWKLLPDGLRGKNKRGEFWANIEICHCESFIKLIRLTCSKCGSVHPQRV